MTHGSNHLVADDVPRGKPRDRDIEEV